MRVGLGQVLYAFEPGRPLVLGGLKIQGAWGLRGPGDGDGLLHAVTDALLGAAGLGDREERFPTGAQPEPSALQVVATLDLLEAAGLAPAHVDVTLTAERAPLRAQRPALRERLASLLRLEPTHVSVKTSVPSGIGALGRAEGILSVALVSLRETSA